MPETLDLERIVANQMTFGDVADHGWNHVGPKGGSVVFAVTNDACVRGEFHEDEVLATELARPVTYNERL